MLFKKTRGKSGLNAAIALLLIATELLCPSYARAAERILVVETRNTSFYNQAVDGFQRGLAARGYGGSQVDIATLALTENSADNSKKIADQLQKKNQMIVTFGTDATSAVMDAHPDVPVVFGMVLDPVALGAVKSLDSPGGGYTGTTLLVNAGKQIDALLQAVPGVHRVGVLYTAGDETSQNFLDQARRDAQSLNAQIVGEQVSNGMSTEQALSKLDNQIDAIWVIPDPASAGPDAFSQTMAYATSHHLPVLGSSSAMVKAGALLALSADISDAGDLTAEMASQILAGTATSAQMAVRAPRKTILSINLDAARALRITVPDSLLHLADEVIDSQLSSNHP